MHVLFFVFAKVLLQGVNQRQQLPVWCVEDPPPATAPDGLSRLILFCLALGIGLTLRVRVVIQRDVSLYGCIRLGGRIVSFTFGICVRIFHLDILVTFSLYRILYHDFICSSHGGGFSTELPVEPNFCLEEIICFASRTLFCHLHPESYLPASVLQIASSARSNQPCNHDTAD